MIGGYMFKVLLVDDESVILDGLRVMIEREISDLEIIGTAFDGTEAYRIIKECVPDIVITDIKMPRMTGLELLEKVRERFEKRISFIVLTGYDDFSYAREALKLEAVDYLLKPVEKKELCAAIKRALLIQNAISMSQKTEGDLQKEILFHNIISLINGKADNACINNIKSCLGRLSGVRYVSIELPCDKALDDEQKRRMQKRLYSACLQHVNDEYRCLFDVSLRGGNYDVGFIYSDELLGDNETEKQYLDRLKSELIKNLNFKFLFIVGSKVDNISDIAKSCKSVAIADTLRTGNSLSEMEEEVHDEFYNSILAVDTKIIDELIRSVSRNKKDDIIAATMSLTESFSTMDNRMIKIIINRLIIGLIEIAGELDNRVDQEEVLRFISDTVYEEENFGSDSENLTGILLQFAGYLDELRSNNSIGIIKNVEEDIKTNFTENLTLKELGAKYFINPSYLGQLFKNRYGMSFKTFLHHIRIERAVQLLLGTDMKMYSIAEAVGYRDTDYFIEHFIAEKGCTPTKYRKENMKNAVS